MKTPSCPRAALVEALRDGRLGPQERASMERHVPVCEVCTAAARDLDRIGEALRAPRERATPLEHQRARLALLRKASEPAAAAAPATPSPFRFAMAAGLLALAVVAGWGGARLTAPSQPPVALHMRPPPRLAPARETALKPSDDARFERTRTAGLDVVTLTQGAVDFTVRPLGPGERFLVRTSDAEIEVRSTAFRVEADRGRIRGVTVAEGSVEVRYAGFSAVIPSGGSWKATSDAPVAAAPAAPTPSAEPVASAAPVVAAVATPKAAPRAPSGPTIAARAAPEPAPQAAMPEPPKEREPEPAVKPAVERRGLTPASLAFADAMQALRRGDYASSAAQLAGFSSAYGSDPRTDEAEYLRAIALQRAGRAADASAAARQYLATRPRGAHRAEARRIAGE